jgi:glycosyltransferase involved in cell wall biosynthesis
LKVIILSDYAIGEQLGGGVELASEYGEKLSIDGIDSYIIVSGGKVNKLRNSATPNPSNIAREVFGLKRSFRILWQIKSKSPDIVWIHQIGHRIPWITLIWIKFFGFPIAITLHDLNIISPRKIGTEVIDFPVSQVIRQLRLSKNVFKNLILKLRFYSIRFIVNFSASSVISIGPIQDTILKSLGVKVTRRIPNGVELCNHNDLQIRNSNSILFAGRLNRKGLNLTIDSIILSNKTFHLYLAGDPELQEYTVERLNHDDFTYLGRLSRSEISQVLHRVKYVACLSQYYDNYPTIVLEAIAHGAFPITSRLTGVAEIVSLISPKLTVEEGQAVDLMELNKLALQFPGVYPDTLDLHHTLTAYKSELSAIHNE